MDTTVIALIAGGVPTALGGLLGFFLKTAFADFREGQKEQTKALSEIKDTLGVHDTAAAVLRKEVDDIRADVSELKERIHKQGTAIQAIELRLPRGRK